MNKGLIALVAGVLIIGGVIFFMKSKTVPSDGTSSSSAVSEKGDSQSSSKQSTAKNVASVTKNLGATSVESVVPGNALIYLSLIDLKSSWEDISNSNFWRKISSLQSVQEAGVGQNLDVFVQQFQAVTGMALTQESIMDLFGQNVSIAITPSSDENPGVTIFSKLSSANQVQSQLDILLQKIGNDVTQETVQHNGHDIVKLKGTADASEVFYTIAGDVLALSAGTSDQNIRDVIDLKKGTASNSLSKNADYQKAINSLSINGDLRMVIYIDLSKVTDLVKALPGAGNVPINLEETLGTMDSIAAAVGVGEGVTLKIMFLKDKSKGSGLLDSWGKNPVKAKSPNLIHSGSILFSSSTSLDIGELWNNWKTNLNQESLAGFQQGITNFEEASGLNVEKDIISMIGNELAFVIHDVDLGGLFPFPKISLFLNVVDRQKASDVMEKLIDALIKLSSPEGVSAQPTISVGNEDYNGQKINFLSVQLPYQAFSPSYAIIDDFLIIGSSKESIKSAIDVSKGKIDSITSDKIYMETTNNFQGKNNQLGYMNLSQTIDIAIDIANWAFTLQKGRGVENPQAEKVLKDNIIPLLECFKAVRSVGVEAINSDEGVEETIFVNVRDLKAA